jgi:cardiolipin synthase C
LSAHHSLSATDVAPVHAGYSKRRKDLLEAGIQLFELKNTGKAGSRMATGYTRWAGRRPACTPSVLAVDANRAFVGSFNFDPRSAELTTEMGFVVHSATLANAFHDGFATTIPQMAYEVRLNEKHELEWADRSGAVRKSPHDGA